MSDNLDKNIGKNIGDAIDDAIGDLRGGGGSTLTGFTYEGPASTAGQTVTLKVTHDDNTTNEQSQVIGKNGSVTFSSLNPNMCNSDSGAQVYMGSNPLTGIMSSPWYGNAKATSRDGSSVSWSSAD